MFGKRYPNCVKKKKIIFLWFIIFINMKLQEELLRMKSIMGLNESYGKKCIPKGYKSGDKFGRNELAKMFVCYTGNPDKFPVVAVREWLFPKLPGGSFIEQDPMKLNFGQPYTFTLEKMASVENKNTRNVTIGVKNINFDDLHVRHKKWFEIKRKQKDFQSRLDYQMNKIRENNYDTTIVTPKDEPIVFESIDKTLYLQEGWHRLMGVMELIKLGEISPNDAKLYCVIVYRTPGYKMNIIEVNEELFENIREYN